MDGMEQAKTVEDVRRAARKALSRLSRTFGEWETLISALKADLSDQQSLTRELRKQVKHLPTNEQIEFLDEKIAGLKNDSKKHKNNRKLAEENRDDWKAESSRLQKDLKKKVREISRLEAQARKPVDSSGTEFTAVADAVRTELETEKTFSREQAEQISRLRKDLVELRTERQALERKLDELQASLDKQARDNNAFEVNEKKVQELRGDLEYARAQLDKQERNENALEANEKKVRELRATLEQANKQIDRLKDKRTDSHIELEANAKQTQELRKELELARGQLGKLSEMEGTLLQADETASEIQKKIASLEFNNRALKKGTDLFLKEKAEARATISELKQTVEEIKVKVRMAEARLAQARAGEESAGEDTLSMSAIQSRDIRFQIQNEELRVKLGNQRMDLDKFQNAAKAATQRYQELKTSNQAQKELIEELQGDIDKHNKDRADNRKSDVQVSQLKAKIDEKQKMIESLQAEILNQKAGGMDKSGPLDARDETQTFKLNADQLATADSLAGKDQQLQIAELKGQLAKKELSMKVVQKSLAELRNRFHKLASQERGDNTIAMPRANAFRADETSATQASGQPDTGSDSSAEIAATVQIRRPEFD
ncbi:MAG: hypothetical protein IIB68_00155 [Proteobacteria bacterium]|nr:hypothetical protein [Pseudomonadota bacterium]